jgi:putative addiction module component (TIGR02574 family)
MDPGDSHAAGGGFQPPHQQLGALRHNFWHIIVGMSQEASDLLKKALNLPVAERAELAGSLIESLDEADDESAQVAWDAEIIRRMEDLNSGKVKPVSLEEARRRLSSAIE